MNRLTRSAVLVLVATVAFAAWGLPTSGQFIESRHGVSDEKAGWKVVAYFGKPGATADSSDAEVGPTTSLLSPSQLAATIYGPNTRRAILHQKDSGMSCKRVTV